MATLPPRKNPTPTKHLKQYLTPLQILLHMGFPKHRSEKALAATGHRGVQLASDWLLAHVNDPTLDDTSPREYILYACPTGPFLQQLQSFWRKSLEHCQWNGAHNYLPHITLVSFFTAQNEMTGNVANLLEKVVEIHRPEWYEDNTVKLESYISPNFMGYFMDEEHTNILKNIAMDYAQEISSFGCPTVSQDSQAKSLHLTLAYQFSPEHFETLKTLVLEMGPPLLSNWELRLYSRDSRIGKNQVHKVLYSHVPREADELELHIGDYIYVSGEALANSPDGWVEGVSWLTGCSGFLPCNYIERTAESDAWTLHRIFQLGKSDETDETEESDISYAPKSAIRVEVSSKQEASTHSEGSDLSRIEDTSIKDELQVKKPPDKQESCAPRQLYVVRHGERVDFTFGSWIPYCFDASGNYVRKDINMPKKMLLRKSWPAGFQRDCPLTKIGEIQATLTGEAMRENAVQVHHVLCSPSLRCIQTCAGILKGLGKSHLPIAIEPGLFEWLGWYPEDLPDWMDVDELLEAGFNIIVNREPYVSTADLANQINETAEEFYERCHFVMKKIVEDTGKGGKGGNVLVVAHAANLDTCTRQLTGSLPRSSDEMRRFCQRVPYCSVAMVSEIVPQSVGDGKKTEESSWKLSEPPFPPLTHSPNLRFDWKVLLS